MHENVRALFSWKKFMPAAIENVLEDVFVQKIFMFFDSIKMLSKFYFSFVLQEKGEMREGNFLNIPIGVFVL